MLETIQTFSLPLWQWVVYLWFGIALLGLVLQACGCLLYYAVLRPLVHRNYRLRAEGKLPDELYWADRLACEWGYFTEPKR